MASPKLNQVIKNAFFNLDHYSDFLSKLHTIFDNVHLRSVDFSLIENIPTIHTDTFIVQENQELILQGMHGLNFIHRNDLAPLKGKPGTYTGKALMSPILIDVNRDGVLTEDHSIDISPFIERGTVELIFTDIFRGARDEDGHFLKYKNRSDLIKDLQKLIAMNIQDQTCLYTLALGKESGGGMYREDIIFALDLIKHPIEAHHDEDLIKTRRLQYCDRLLTFIQTFEG